MTFSKQSKRLGQFEVLEAKKLFAVDVIGIAAPVEVSIVDPEDCPNIMDPQDCPSVMDPGDCPNVVDPNDCPNLGGQEGEPFYYGAREDGPADDIVDRVF